MTGSQGQDDELPTFRFGSGRATAETIVAARSCVGTVMMTGAAMDPSDWL